MQYLIVLFWRHIRTKIPIGYPIDLTHIDPIVWSHAIRCDPVDGIGIYGRSIESVTVFLHRRALDMTQFGILLSGKCTFHDIHIRVNIM